MKNLGKVGLIGRFKPLHNGGAKFLDTVCKQSDHVIIGLGSSNRHGLRNPFSAVESEEMVRAYLSPNFSNYETIFIPDSGHLPEYSDGQKWRMDILSGFKNLNFFVTGNLYVSELLRNDYQIINPNNLSKNSLIDRLSATDVRIAMAKEEDWKSLVPLVVADYLESKGLVDRFKKEFGTQTIDFASNYFNNRNKYSLNYEKECTKKD